MNKNKKPYRKPTLKTHGSLADLTKAKRPFPPSDLQGSGDVS